MLIFVNYGSQCNLNNNIILIKLQHLKYTGNDEWIMCMQIIEYMSYMTYICFCFSLLRTH